MPENNIVKNWSNWQIDELADWLQEASEIMNRAIVADSQGRDTDSLEQMRTLFGKIFCVRALRTSKLYSTIRQKNNTCGMALKASSRYTKL